MWRTTIRTVGAHKRRLLATCSAVLLGVAFLSGTLVLGETMRAGFLDMFTEANAGIDAYVRSGTVVGAGDFVERGVVDADLVGVVASIDGVDAVAPVIEARGQIVGRDGDPLGGNGPPTLAGNWIDDETLNPWRIAEGRPPARPGEVVIDRGSARNGDLAVGDPTTVRTPEPLPVTVVGIASFGRADSQGPVTWAAFTTEQAREVLLPDPGALTAVGASAGNGVDDAELAERVRRALPDGTEVLTGAALTEEQQADIESDFLGFFEAMLLVFAGIALVVATFSIYNTFSILVAQRTRESALLRALGASRRQVLGSVLAEAVIVGVVASALGIGAGIGLAAALTALAEGAGFPLSSTPLEVTTGSVGVSLAVGVAVTVVASLAPARRASRVAPLAALRDVAIDRSAASVVRAVAGAVVTGAGVVLAVAGTGGDGSLPATGLGALLCVVGVVLLGPVAARPAAAVLGAPLAARRRMSGSLARRNAMRNPRRTAGTASALMVGVAVVTLFTVVAASVTRAIDDTVEAQFGGDLVIATHDWSGSGLGPGLAAAVADVPEVAVSTGIGNAPVTIDGDAYVASVADPAGLDRVLDLAPTAGTVADLGAADVAISSSFAADRGYELGDRLNVGHGDGTTTELRVGAVFDNDELVSGVLLPEAAWAPHAAARPSYVAVLIGLADGVSTAAGAAAVQPVADRFGAPDVQDRDEYVETVAGQVDQMLTIVYVLLALAIVIALMGIANTLSLSVHERTRELGLLRAVGQGRRQLRAMVRGEALVVALFGTIGGLALGTFLAWAVVGALDGEGPVSFTVPGGQLAWVVVLGGLVGVIAALRPARRAARLDVLTAIATD
jgi:putative ABC transport system permease protein